MAENIFRVVYPLQAFDGGLNNKYDATIIDDSEAHDCKNVVFDEVGGVKTRDGIKKFNTASVGSFIGEGLFTARFNDGTEQMLGWWNGSMYKLTGTSFITVPSAQSVFTAGTRVDAAMYQNLMFFGNGGSKPYKWNGTEFTRHGIPQPNSGPTAVSGTAGASRPPTGDINYKLSYVNSYLVEGDVSAETTTLTIATSASVSLTSLPIAPVSFGVSARKLYRRDSGSSATYKLVTTINDNTTTTYTDTTPSTSLGASAPTDQAEPSNWKFIKAHKERLFTVDPVNPSYLNYSELGNPFVFKVLNFFKAGDGDGEVIRGIGVHTDTISTYKDACVWLLYMPDTDPANWLMIRSNSKYGGGSHYAVIDYDNLQMFIGKRYNRLAGFHALSGVNTQPNAVQLTTTGVYSESQSDKIEPEIFNLNASYIHLSAGIDYKNKIWMSVPGSNQTVNTLIYQFDYLRREKSSTKGGSWVPFTMPVGFTAFTIYGGLLYGQSSTANGFVYLMENGGVFNDDGTAIDSYWLSKEFTGHPQHLENQKDFRFSNFVVEALGNYYMSVRRIIDGDTSLGVESTVNLSPGGSLWGAMVWGVDPWGGAKERTKVTLYFGTASGKRLQIRFDNQNTVNQGFHVYGSASFSYNVRGKR